MEHQNNHPTPENVMKMGTSFWASKILLTAVNFQLFTILAEKKSMPASAIKSKLAFQCSDRHVFDFLDTLTGFGFLNREGVLESAFYSNSIDTDTFLDKNKPSNIGGILEMMNNRLYGFWGNLEEGLLTGEAQNEVKNGNNTFEKFYEDPNRLRLFVHAMSGIQMGNFIAFANTFDFSIYKTLTDAGGSAGLLSLMVAKHQPHMSCTTFDLPQVEPIATETIQKFQLDGKVKAVSGDFNRWAKMAGFKTTSLLPLAGPTSAAIAYK